MLTGKESSTRTSGELRASLGRFLRQLSPRRKRQLVLLLGLMLLGAIAELLSIGAVLPFISVLANPEATAKMRIVGRLMAATGLTLAQLPLAVSAVFAGLVVLAAAARLLMLSASIRYANGLGAEIGESLYARTLQRPYSFHVSHNTSVIIGSINKVQKLIVSYVQPLLTGATALVVAMAIVLLLVAINPGVALAGAFTFGACYFLIAARVRKRLRENGSAIALTNDQRIQAIQEGLGGIRDVILDRAQPIYSRRFSRIEQRLRRAQASSQFTSTFPRVAIEAIGMLLLVGFAVYFSGTGRDFNTILPTLGILAVGAAKLMPLFQQVYAGWSAALSGQASVNDVLDLLEYEPLPQPDLDAIPFRNEICMQQVVFQYEATTAPTPVLHDINLRIRRGEKIGIVGVTGSGKSTLVDLLMGLLSPTSGHFSVDGVKVTPANAAAWQKHIAHVPQSIFLSDASVAENIAFGTPPNKIDQARLEAVSRIAQIHDHVCSLAEGYQTPVGERGVRLSGGQRQRIGIARALYKGVDVLVLDEATSALDDATEDRVMSGLGEMAGDMTMIMIAHRLTTLRNCDRIVHLAKGRIQQTTSYQLLLTERQAVFDSLQIAPHT
ncbi:ABC transporter ATP-binding protein [Dokdonella immobilis]|uniref:ATP-binding cassette, subfamily B n=1 Tax=Dokdonella immobilis TaxID=578942 RepID=A0A1I4Y2R2_9GAMM|nr:ABC transporter ATP-binding protein [Dokdonella immobilis]SFN31800.1 ATP-binding cassette, subfamily B [Dokdonella immobilis]